MPAEQKHILVPKPKLSRPIFLKFKNPTQHSLKHRLRFFTVDTERLECVNAPQLCYSDGRKSQETHAHSGPKPIY